METQTPFDSKLAIVERKLEALRAQHDALRLVRDRYLDSYARRVAERAVEAELRTLK